MWAWAKPLRRSRAPARLFARNASTCRPHLTPAPLTAFYRYRLSSPSPSPHSTPPNYCFKLRWYADSACDAESAGRTVAGGGKRWRRQGRAAEPLRSCLPTSLKLSASVLWRSDAETPAFLTTWRGRSRGIFYRYLAPVTLTSPATASSRTSYLLRLS